MPVQPIDVRATCLELERLREDLVRAGDDPKMLQAYGQRLSQLGAEITAACERAFVELTESPAA